MTYNADLSWVVLANGAGGMSRTMLKTLREGEAEYDRWQNFRAARTNAQIATALARTEGEIVELDSCYSAFKEIRDFANNVAAPTQSDRLYSMRKFA